MILMIHGMNTMKPKEELNQTKISLLLSNRYQVIPTIQMMSTLKRSLSRWLIMRSQDQKNKRKLKK